MKSAREGGRNRRRGREEWLGNTGQTLERLMCPPPSVLVMCKVGSRDQIGVVNITTWMRVIIIIESLGESLS